VIPRKHRGRGKDSLDKAAIEKLAVKYEDPRMIKLLEFKSRNTVVTRYFREAKDFARHRARTWRLQYAQREARWHCTDPNQQQVKRPEYS